ncbi:uncharacterized protein [Tursiops truncatus]|uniref:uncharacterized protein n=1 Tax=Tursiops truncatus TaxID=9739 RepID=UPI003CCF7533
MGRDAAGPQWYTGLTSLDPREAWNTLPQALWTAHTSRLMSTSADATLPGSAQHALGDPQAPFGEEPLWRTSDYVLYLSAPSARATPPRTTGSGHGTLLPLHRPAAPARLHGQALIKIVLPDVARRDRRLSPKASVHPWGRELGPSGSQVKGALNQDPGDQAPGQSQTDELSCPRPPYAGPQAKAQSWPRVAWAQGAALGPPARHAEPHHRQGQGLGPAANPEAGLLAGSAMALSSRAGGTRETLGWPGLNSGQALCPGASHPAVWPGLNKVYHRTKALCTCLACLKHSVLAIYFTFK